MQAAQLPLSLAVRDDATFANYYSDNNNHVLDAIHQLIGNKDTHYNVLHLWGSSGVGKSHLLQAICNYADINKVSAFYLSLGEVINYSEFVLEGLESYQLLCIDDVELIAGKKNWEEALFHLYNRALENKVKMIFASEFAPANSDIALPDLRSRLGWGVVYKLTALTDDDKVKVLQLRAKNRGLELTQQVGEYLLNRCPRDMNKLFDCLDTLDKASLVAKRRITVPFVKQVLFAVTS